MTRWRVVAVVISLGACGSPPATAPTAPGSTASTSTTRPTGTACDAARPRVEQLARSNAAERAPSRAAELAADNTAMVMNDCASAPDKIAACIAAAASFTDLEARCLVPIDDEGTEGDRPTH